MRRGNDDTHTPALATSDMSGLSAGEAESCLLRPLLAVIRGVAGLYLALQPPALFAGQPGLRNFST
jgi:hypothetical protein